MCLASICKAGVVSVELVANQIDNEYSLPPLPQEQEGGVKDWLAKESENM